MRINGGFFVLRPRDLRLDEAGRGAGAGALPAPRRRRQAAGLSPTTASGRAWTPSRTSSSSRTSTRAARSRGRSGRRTRAPTLETGSADEGFAAAVTESKRTKCISILEEGGPPRRILALGAHSDDIEIGCGGTILRLASRTPRAGGAVGRLLRDAANGRRRRAHRPPRSSRESRPRGSSSGTTGTASFPIPAPR